MVLTSASPISRIKSTKNDTLKIRYLKPWPDREKKNQLTELKSLEAFGLEVGLSWPMDWGQKGLRFLVDGKEAPFRESGGVSGKDGMRAIFLFLSVNPGKKS
ncbi:MAG: hypothetical protein ACUVRL_05785 [Candidatus Saccharicenans sp.]|uniref:hypothetical protein n=1 Tax=Candidatus Saccharicenans sp. TaxID=2819258 RepID=UPI00404B6BFA